MLTKTILENKVLEAISPVSASMGFSIVRVRLFKTRSSTLQIMAENTETGSMLINECERLSKAISLVLDAQDLINDRYVLEVSSPGIDRPLTRVQDFLRFMNCKVVCETKEQVDGRRRFQGYISDFQPKNCTENEISKMKETFGNIYAANDDMPKTPSSSKEDAVITIVADEPISKEQDGNKYQLLFSWLTKAKLVSSNEKLAEA